MPAPWYARIRIRCLTQCRLTARRSALNLPPSADGPVAGSSSVSATVWVSANVWVSATVSVSVADEGSPDLSGSGLAGSGCIGWPSSPRPARIIGPPCLRLTDPYLPFVHRFVQGSTRPGSPPIAGHVRAPDLPAAARRRPLAVGCGAKVHQVALRETSLRPPPQWLTRWEIFVVLAVSLGASALNALLSLVGSLLQSKPLAGQQALLVGSLAPFNRWLDLVLQLTSIAENLAPVALVLYLMARSGEPPSVIGLDASQPGKDAGRGAVLAALIGGCGLGLYLAGFHLGFNLDVVPRRLPAGRWLSPA